MNRRFFYPQSSTKRMLCKHVQEISLPSYQSNWCDVLLWNLKDLDTGSNASVRTSKKLSSSYINQYGDVCCFLDIPDSENETRFSGFKTKLLKHSTNNPTLSVARLSAQKQCFLMQIPPDSLRSGFKVIFLPEGAEELRDSVGVPAASRHEKRSRSQPDSADSLLCSAALERERWKSVDTVLCWFLIGANARFRELPFTLGTMSSYTLSVSNIDEEKSLTIPKVLE